MVPQGASDCHSRSSETMDESAAEVASTSIEPDTHANRWPWMGFSEASKQSGGLCLGILRPLIESCHECGVYLLPGSFEATP